MEKIPGNLLKNLEISWNFVSPKKWEPFHSTSKTYAEKSSIGPAELVDPIN